MARLQKSPIVPIAALTLWTVAVGYGFWHMTRYDATPGASAAAPSDWPRQWDASTPLRLDTARGAKTLVVFVHPQCPCTRATIGNLATALARESPSGSVGVTVAIYEPRAHAGPEWEDSDLVRSAAELPNATVLFDPGGALARRFGAETSGQTLVYDSAGRLLFSGGVTDERGHYGDSIGSDAVKAIAEGVTPGTRTAPVYGCSLLPGHSAPMKFMPQDAPMLPINHAPEKLSF